MIRQSLIIQILILAGIVNGQVVHPGLVDVACSRDTTLPYCGKETKREPVDTRVETTGLVNGNQEFLKRRYKDDVTLWPDSKEETQMRLDRRSKPARLLDSGDGLIDAYDLVTRPKKHRRHSHTHHGHRRRRVRKDRTEETTTTHLNERELYKKLKSLSDLTNDPVHLTKSIVSPDRDAEQETTRERTDVGRKHRARARAAVPVVPSDAAYGSGSFDEFKVFDGYTDNGGILHRPRSSSPFTKPGLWEPNPADPHSRDPTNKYWYHPDSVGVDWLNGQIQWNGHWAVPAAGTGGTDGFSDVHFPTIGNFLNIVDDYD